MSTIERIFAELPRMLREAAEEEDRLFQQGKLRMRAKINKLKSGIVTRSKKK